MPWLIPLFYKPDDGPVGSKHIVQLLVVQYEQCTTLLYKDGPIKYTMILEKLNPKGRNSKLEKISD